MNAKRMRQIDERDDVATMDEMVLGCLFCLVFVGVAAVCMGLLLWRVGTECGWL